MRRMNLLTIAMMTVALTACSGPSTGTGESGSCAATVHFRGRSYLAQGDVVVPPRSIGTELGAATVQACEDTNGTDGTDRDEYVSAIRGVHPSVAIAVGTPASLYFIAGLRRSEVPKWLVPVLAPDAHWPRGS